MSPRSSWNTPGNSPRPGRRCRTTWPSPAAPKGPADSLLGIWSGRWNGVQPLTVAVERIKDQTATIVYAWGRAPTWGIEDGGWRRQDATVEKDTLTASLPGGATASFSLAPRRQPAGPLPGRRPQAPVDLAPHAVAPLRNSTVLGKYTFLLLVLRAIEDPAADAGPARRAALHRSRQIRVGLTFLLRNFRSH